MLQSLVSIAVVAVCGILVPLGLAESDQYNVPNPFVRPNKGYYSIKSFQATTSAQGKRTQVDVTEYFSLETGLTYSTHRNRDDSSQVFALIGDGSRGRFYVVRNPDSEDEFDCELDHLHYHKQVFPWQYHYETTPDEDADRTSAKFIYGVGAIWLNLIKSQVVSSQIGDSSPYEVANVWQLEQGHLLIKLLFEKPRPRRGIDMGILIANSKLNYIHMRRSTLNSANGSSSAGLEYSYIEIISFDTDIDSQPVLKSLSRQLDRCSKQTARHHVFPSLMKAFSLSLQRLFVIEYTSSKFGGRRVDEKLSGRYNDQQRRRVWNTEFVREWSSLQQEAQMISYEGLFLGLNKDSSEPVEQVVDVFLKRFTENEKGRSSRHSSVFYHMIERQRQIETCERGNKELPVILDHLMNRPIEFHRRNGTGLSAKLIGLSALLLNAADIHYKEFNLFKKQLSVAYDASNLNVKKLIRVDEWQFGDKKTGRRLNFYFKQLKRGGKKQHEMSDLVRIDIYDTTFVADSGQATNTGGEEEPGLIERFDIIAIAFEADDDEIQLMLTPAPCCGPPGNDFPEEDVDEAGNAEIDDDYYKYIPNANEGNDMEKVDQKEGEDFEFEPGRLMESFQFPDFFEFLGGKSNYRIESTLEIVPSTAASGSHILLRETVNIEKGWAKISAFLISDKNEVSPIPEFEYFIDYFSETMFKLARNRMYCFVVDNVESWLRLLSAKIDYNISPGETTEVIMEGNRLRLYGAGALWRSASESAYADFVGMKENTVRDSEGHIFKQILWSLADDDDNDMKIMFNFLWNLTQWELDTGNKVSQRTIELLALDSISASNLLNEEQTSQFNGFKLQVNSFSREEESRSLELPEECNVAAEAAIKRLERKFSDYQPLIPSFLDYLNSAESYTIKYTINHTPTSKKTQDVTSASVVSVEELFDRSMNRGKLILIDERRIQREIFIDGTTRSTFMFSTDARTCEKISVIRTLVDLGAEFSTENPEFSADRMHGLAALWQRLAQIRGASIRITHRDINMDGNLFAVHTYKASRSWTMSPQSDDVSSYSIQASFVVHPLPSRDSTTERSNEFVLDRIEIHPKQLKKSVTSLMHSTIIDVKSVSRESQIASNWQLPEQCLSLSDGQNIAANQFPRLINTVRSSANLYMRAEISTWSPVMSFDEKHFLMDEWLHNRSVRMKTTNLRKNLDLLIFIGSGESFDLSHQYNCSLNLPRLDSYESIADSKIIQFWRDNETLVDNPSHLYYGPLSLWWLAEKNIDHVKLVNALDIAPKPASGEKTSSSASKLAEEARTEVWKVSSPDNDSKLPWSYEMHFEKYSILDDKQALKEWRVLQRIVLESPDSSNSILEIEVINYSWTLSELDIMNNFMLPEGYNCERSHEVLGEWRKTSEDLSLDTSKSFSLNYEASLELRSNDAEQGKRGNYLVNLVLPKLIGSLTRSSRSSAHSDLYSHFHQVRSPEGNLLNSTKCVYDTSRTISYEIDRLIGSCQIKSTGTNFNWRLSFPNGVNQTELVTIDDLLFETLFLDTVNKNFMPLNRYTSNGLLISTYERSYPSMSLKQYLSGPVTLVRRYESAMKMHDHLYQRLGVGVTNTELQNSMSVKVLMFDKNRSIVRSTLSIILEQVVNNQLTDVVRAMEVSECFDEGKQSQGSRAFALVYDIEPGEVRDWALSNVEAIEAQFIEMLIREGGISLTQFNGLPRIEFESSHDKQLKIYFNLIKPPTSINYFARRQGFKISDELRADAEIKLVASVEECSAWCDQMGCIGMSWCSDRSCRITSNYTIPAKSGYTQQSLTFLLNLVVIDRDCTYFFATTSRLRTLESFVDHLGSSINDASASDQDLGSLSLKINGVPVYPYEFYSLDSDFSLNEEDDKDSSKLLGAYKILKNNRQLDATKLKTLQNNAGNKFDLRITQARRYKDCLDTCKSDDCVLISYCRQEGFCVSVSGRVNLLETESSVEEDKFGCTIAIRDFLLSFTKFEDTLEPIRFERRIEHLSSIQCAAACESSADWQAEGSNKFVCLSFDWCRSVPVHSNQSSPQSSDNSYCLLQRDHLIQDNFDRSIFGQQSDPVRSRLQPTNGINGELVLCDHYSRDVLADFLKIPNREYILANTVQRGCSVEKCALECQSDDQCWAFEHCLDTQLQLAQTCRFFRAAPVKGRETLDRWIEDFVKQLTVSKKCSVFTLKHLEQSHTVTMVDTMNELDDETDRIIRHPNRTFPIVMLSLLFYVAGATLLGCLVRLAYDGRLRMSSVRC